MTMAMMIAKTAETIIPSIKVKPRLVMSYFNMAHPFHFHNRVRFTGKADDVHDK